MDPARSGAPLPSPPPNPSPPSAPPSPSGPPSLHRRPAPVPAGKKLVFSLVLVVLLWGLVELACFVGLWELSRYKDLEYSPELFRSLSELDLGVLEFILAGKPTDLAFSLSLRLPREPMNSYHTFPAIGVCICP